MEGLLFLGFVVVVIAAALSRWLASPRFKGALGERAVHSALTRALAGPDCALLRDVTLRTERGTTQIDQVAVSPFGIFVVETKNMRGRIFGSQQDTQWTQSFPGRKSRFQNPLRQNHAHVMALQELLGLDSSKFHSIVVFAGSVTFKTSMPANVLTLRDLPDYIRGRSAPLLSAAEMKDAVEVIESARLARGAATNAAHVRSLRTRGRSVAGAAKTAHGVLRQRRITAFLFRIAAVVAVFAVYVFVVNHLFEAIPDLLTVGAPPKPVTAAREQQTRQADRNAWKASLLCGYSTDTMRCACYEPKGAKVDISFDECKALADGSRR